MITENMGTYKKHHTVQVAMCAYSFVRTLVNALVLQGKTPPAQVAAGDDDHDCATCAGGVFLSPTGKNTPLAVMVVIVHCNLRWWCFFLKH